MRIISRKARVVCATIATLTSATILASTLIGLTSTEPAALSMAQSSGDQPVPVAAPA